LNRAILIVLDGVGAGAAPDAAEFGDPNEPSTLLHVWEAAGGIRAPNLAAAGFLSAGQITDDRLRRAGLPTPREAAPPPGSPDESGSPASPSRGEAGWGYGRLKPLSKGGKDSVTGHWEMMGIVLDEPFPTYPNGFPIKLIKEFEKRIERQTLGNRAASGTQIIQELGGLHMETGFPIVYTSADSVFQIACHEEIVAVELLYEMCGIARDVCIPPNGVQRVIARPFVGSPEAGFTRTDGRKDFPLPPPRNLVDEIGDVFGIGVVPELFCHRGFREVPRTQSNPEHVKTMWTALESDARFIFANFEDFDMRYGHRNDALGFARCLEEFDSFLGELLEMLRAGDLLVLTADHGNDPTDESTDHSREFVPFAAFGSPEHEGDLGDVDGFAFAGEIVARHLRKQ